MSEEEVPVEGEGGEGEVGEGENKAEPPVTLKVRIESCRNVPDDAKTTVSYAYSLKRPVLNDEGEAEEDEEALKATYEAPEEMDPEEEGYVPVIPNKYDLETAHELPAVSEEMLYRLITAPLEIKVGLQLPNILILSLLLIIHQHSHSSSSSFLLLHLLPPKLQRIPREQHSRGPQPAAQTQPTTNAWNPIVRRSRAF